MLSLPFFLFFLRSAFAQAGIIVVVVVVVVMSYYIYMDLFQYKKREKV